MREARFAAAEVIDGGSPREKEPKYFGMAERGRAVQRGFVAFIESSTSKNFASHVVVDFAYREKTANSGYVP